MSAAELWKLDLAEWAIPQTILDAAPESPWGFSVELFERRADAARKQETPSTLRAAEALPEGGSVLDVGCGAGRASLPLAAKAHQLIGVDASGEMLEAFRSRAEVEGRAAVLIQGSWPHVANQTPAADVVVCHHVAYNVPQLDAFVTALTDHARRRVVMELTAAHPMSRLNDLWLRFHGLRRPTRPTADDAVAVLREAGLEPRREDWEESPFGWLDGFESRDGLVAWSRRRLCLPQERDAEIREALAEQAAGQEGRVGFGPSKVVTLWWEGRSA